jgi:endoglucanase Acf2
MKYISFSMALCLVSCAAYADVQQPFDTSAPKIAVGNTNGFLPDKPYSEYYYDVNTKTIKDGASRNPIPFVNLTRKVYQTDKWYTDLSFAAIDRPAINMYDDFRTAESPLNIRIIDSVIHDQPGSASGHIIAFPGLWVTAPKKPFLAVTAKPSPQKIMTDTYAYTLQSDSALDLAFAIPETLAKNADYRISREILADQTDDLTFTTRWHASKAGVADATMTAPIVRGAPYVTMVYDNMPVALNGLNLLAISADGGPVHFLMDEVGKQSYTGKRFKLVVAASQDNYGCNKNGTVSDSNGNVTCQPLYSVYMLYTSKPITLSFKPTTPAQPIEILSDTAPFTGVARMAYAGSIAKTVNDSVKDASMKIAAGTDGDFTKAVAVLDKYSNVYPTGVNINVDTNADKGSVKFHFKTAAFDNGSGNTQLLMAAYEATQLANMSVAPSDASDYMVDTVRGHMRGVVGQDWTQTIALPLASSPNALWYGNQTLNPAYQKVLLDSLNSDMKLLDNNTQEPGNSLNVHDVTMDSYAFGKKIARLGRLALIADELGQKDKAELIVKNYMEPAMNAWLKPATPNPDIHGLHQGYFKYDDKFGGVLTARASVRPEECANEPNGLVQCGANLDFYNGMYTDHHFHYGYFLYAAAVMAKIDPTWKQEYQPYVDLLARDIANPSTQDPYFPTYRHFDWFEGHGFADGNGPTASGRNQESSSEAVNAWYGVALWGNVTGRPSMQAVGQVLTGMEIQAAKVWTQIIPGKSVYDDYTISSADKLHNPFGADVSMAGSGVTGINWSVKVDHSTYFGNKLGYINGIEMLPYTPITTELFSKEWVDANKATAIQQATSALTQQMLLYTDMTKALNAYGQDSQNWLGFQGIPNGGYQWGQIVAPIQSLDGSSGSQLFDSIFNTGYPQVMHTINDNLISSGLLGANSVKLNCGAGTFFDRGCQFQIGTLTIPYSVPFTFADYRGLDNGMTYTNMLWWLAKTDRTTQGSLNWKRLSVAGLSATVDKTTLTAHWTATETDPTATVSQYVVNLLQFNPTTKAYSVAKTITQMPNQAGVGDHAGTATFTDVAKGQYGIVVFAKDSNGVQGTAFSSQQIAVDGGSAPPVPPNGETHTLQVAMGVTKNAAVATPASVSIKNGDAFTAKGSFTVTGDFSNVHMNCTINMVDSNVAHWTRTPLGAPNSCDGPNPSFDGSKYWLYLP